MTESWQPQACRRPPPCCPRPADCSSPRSSHCGRCQSATGPPAPPSHLKEEETYTHRIQYQWVAITVCVCVTCTLRWLCPVGVWTWTCECKKRGHIFCMGSCCQKQLRSHVRATNVKLHYFDWTPPLRIILIKDCLCKAIPSLLWKKNNCPLGLDRPRGGSVCDHVMSVSALKCVPPPCFTSLGGLLRGKDTSREICLICTDGSLFVCVCVRSRGYIFSQCLHCFVYVRLSVCVFVSDISWLVSIKTFLAEWTSERKKKVLSFHLPLSFNGRWLVVRCYARNRKTKT